MARLYSMPQTYPTLGEKRYCRGLSIYISGLKGGEELRF